MDFDAEKFQSLKCTPVVSLTKLLMRGCKKKKKNSWVGGIILFPRGEGSDAYFR